MSKFEVGSRVRVDWPETIYEGLHGVEGVVVRSNDHATLVRLAHGVEQWLSTPRLRKEES